MASTSTARTRRHRAHRNGNHDLCLPGCLTRPVRGSAAQEPARLAAAALAEFPTSDEFSRALALRLVELAGGQGAAAVQACRALGEMAAAQRAPDGWQQS